MHSEAHAGEPDNAILRMSCGPTFVFIRLRLPLYHTVPFLITTLRNDLLLALNTVLLLNAQKVSIHPARACSRTCSTYLELLDQGVVDLAVHGREDALLGEGSVEDLLDGDGAGDTDCDVSVQMQRLCLVGKGVGGLTELGHGRVTVGLVAAVLDEGRGAGLLRAVLELDLEPVLEAVGASASYSPRRTGTCFPVSLRVSILSKRQGGALT